MDCLIVSRILLLVAICTSSVQSGCSPAEEGSDVTIDYIIDKPLCDGGYLQWGNGLESGWCLMFCDCKPGGPTECECYNPALYSATIEDYGNNQYRSLLTFKSMTRNVFHSKQYKYSGPYFVRMQGCQPKDYRHHHPCTNLELYVKPINPTCVLQVLSGSQASIQVRCTTDKVFPQAECLFYMSSNGATAKNIDGDISYQHTPSGTNFTSQCTLTVPVTSDLGVGTHGFHVNMYPSVTGGENYGVLSPPVTTKLTLPEVRVAIPDDVKTNGNYVKGRSANVKCELTSDGNPKGQARWFDSHGVELPNQGDGDSSTHLFSFGDVSPPVCKGKSSLGFSNVKSFIHHFAFMDDDAVSLVIKDGKTSLCSPSDKVVVTCQLDIRKAHPEPYVQFSTDGQNYDKPVQASFIGAFYDRDYTIQNGGQFNVYCRVTNPFFSSITKDKSLPVTVKEPPSSAPSITVNNKNYGQKFDSTAGENVDITCQVSGGNPPTNVALTCGQGGSYTATGAGSATLNGLKLTREMDGTKCVCTGKHDSGCYSNKSSELLLSVSLKPVNPTCQLQVLSGSQASIQVRCTTDKVFPEAKCLFYVYSSGAPGRPIPGAASYQHQPNGNNFQSECTLKVPINSRNMGVGRHSFYVKMYPDVPNGESYGVDSPPVDTVLTLPEVRVAISDDVEKTASYVNGPSVNVKCELTSDGNPKGQARWFDSHGVELPNQGDGDSSTHLFSADDVSRPVCRGKSAVGLSNVKSFTHQFAFVDDDALSLVIKDGKTNLCSPSDKVVVKCQVDKSKVNPAATIQFSIDGQNYDTPVPGSESGGLLEREYTIQNGGQFNVHCRVTNTIFSSITKDKSLPVTAKEPSPNAPSITINNKNYGQKFDSTAGENINIACQVSGGYPPAKLVLTCFQDGSHTARAAGSAAISRVKLTGEMDGTKCVCTGTHDSGCYSNNTSELPLFILYKPQVSISAGTGNSAVEQKSHSLVVNQNSKVNLKCVVEGNPNPSFSLHRQEKELKSKSLDSKSGSLSYEIPSASCDDSDAYACLGRNSQGTSESRVNVFVKCPFSRDATRFQDGDLPKMKKTVDGDTMLYLHLLGYPNPTLYILKKGPAQGQDGERRKRETATAFDNLPDASLDFDKYVSRDESSPNQMTVKIVLLNPSTSDVGRYTLAVGNGIGENLLIEFDLTESQVSEKRETAAFHSKDGGVGTNTAVIVVGALTGVLGLIFVTALIILRSRRKSRERKGEDNVHYDSKEGGKLSIKY